MIAPRAATEGELPAALALLRACVADMQAHGIDQWDDVYPDATTLAADIRAGALHVSFDAGGALVGAVTLNDHQDPEYADVAWGDQVGPVAVVHRLMVAPAAQRRGLGTALMRFAEERAAGEGRRSLRLDTFAGNPGALALYRRLGYREVGTVRFRKGTFYCFELSLVSS